MGMRRYIIHRPLDYKIISFYTQHIVYHLLFIRQRVVSPLKFFDWTLSAIKNDKIPFIL